MVGAGQTNHHPATARILDVTRLVNRAGLLPTGVDRVERAYLSELAARSDVPFFAIARTALGYVVLDHAGARALADAVKTGEWGQADIISRLNPRLDGSRKIGQSFVRRHRFARSGRRGLSALLGRIVPDGFTYLNVGHSNLNARMFDGLNGAKKVVLLHDTIPLDWPQTQRNGATDAFARKLELVSKNVDLVVCTSDQCALDVTRHLLPMGRIPPMITAHLGVDTVTPDPSYEPPEKPYFVSVGTIEPRKNHAMLLDIWAEWVDAPPLYFCGKRGWNNSAVFERLDAKPDNVIECNDLSDGQIAALVSGANAMLFPSFAEGFGLPPAEALALGTRVVCADLPVYREILGDSAVYVDPNDRYLWEKTIKKMAGSQDSVAKQAFVPPSWDRHFKTVLSNI